MRNSNTLWLVAGIMLLLDLYVFQAIRTITFNHFIKARVWIFSIYWLISIGTIVFLLSIPYNPSLQTSVFFRNYVFAILVGIFIAKIIAVIFFFIDDIRRVIVWITNKFQSNTTTVTAKIAAENNISRSVFLSWLGIGAGAAFFGTLLYGFSNKYHYQLRKVALSFNNLPTAFKGFKIIQISDIHSGSFQNKKAVEKGIKMILEQQPDMILFTGDLVNDRHEEMLEYIDIFSKLKAPYGVYSILGNHDYGDYIFWKSEEAKQENVEKLKQIHAQMGWRLLMNEHVVIEKDTDAFALLGIENWGAKAHFPKYGKMKEAYKGAEKYAFKILMSHDPSHWDAEVRKKYTDIDLMLAGHTHGMQFGIENPYFKWSPVQWMYKQWAGLYEEDNQKLYVNRGFGFIGYPGRVGILPEITLIELA
ncbi:MAG: metallophosphoesterase [Chitinophagaceae bacterium]|nr:metallophosphoesterase [Chitinophagaceae bacterium]MCW5906211.1 metallophosphoesterase [Chitinophagaceae bacterium]